jgi:hypothetical protein
LFSNNIDLKLRESNYTTGSDIQVEFCIGSKITNSGDVPTRKHSFKVVNLANTFREEDVNVRQQQCVCVGWGGGITDTN